MIFECHRFTNTPDVPTAEFLESRLLTSLGRNANLRDEVANYFEEASKAVDANYIVAEAQFKHIETVVNSIMEACEDAQDYVCAGRVAYYTQFFMLKLPTKDAKSAKRTTDATTIMELLDQQDEAEMDSVPKKIGDVIYECDISRTKAFWVRIFAYFCELKVKDNPKKLEVWRLVVNMYYRNYCVLRSLLMEVHLSILELVCKELKIPSSDVQKLNAKIQELIKLKESGPSEIYAPGMPFIFKPYVNGDPIV